MYIFLIYSLSCFLLGYFIYLFVRNNGKNNNIFVIDTMVNAFQNNYNIDIIILVDNNYDENNDSKYIVSLEDSDRFIKKLRKNSQTDKLIYLIIHSNGGSINSSDVIINAMLLHNNPIYTFVPLYACSAASLIALTGNRLFMDSYSYLTPTEPQFTTDNKTFSSRVLLDFLDLIRKKNNYNDSEIILDAIDAKIYHDDNINTLKKILNRKNISRTMMVNIINIFTYGNLPHHYPLDPYKLEEIGIPVEKYIPDKLVNICKFIIKKN